MILRLLLPARPASLVAVVVAGFASGCSQSMDVLDSVRTSAFNTIGLRSAAYSASDKECMTRAMFFESHRSSREGMIAVGTVVMNRVASDQFPDKVCDVVGQKKQFAPGVMTREMNSRALPDVQAAAEAVLKGERHPKLGKDVKFFHQAGLTFPYTNMHYVHVAGGNAFYEKRRGARRAAPVQIARAKPERAPAPERVAAPLPEEQPTAALSFGNEQAIADRIGNAFAY
jgi:spore germination cell wall hydrolase CwlJ-like protein